MSTPHRPDDQPRRFTVTIAPGVLDDAAAYALEQEIQRTVADTLATFDLADRVQLVDPVKELAEQGPSKGFDWLSLSLQSYVTAGIVAAPITSVIGPVLPPAAPGS